MGWKDLAIPLSPEVPTTKQSTGTIGTTWRSTALPIDGTQIQEPTPLSEDELRQSMLKIESERKLAEAHRQLESSYLPGYLAFGVGAGADIVSPLARAVGQSKYADEMNRWAATVEQAQGERERGGITPDILERGVRGAARSAVPMVAAAQVGGPYAAIGVAAVQEANRAVTEGRDAGMKGISLASYAISQGIIEAVPAAVMQKIGLGGAESLAAKRGLVSGGVKEGLKSIGIALAQELPEELVTEISHNGASKIVGLDEEALSAPRLKQTIVDTTVQTVLTMAALGGPQIRQRATPGERLTRMVEADEIQRRRRIIETAVSDKPVSRKTWAELGLPPVLGQTATNRKSNIQKLASILATDPETTNALETMREIQQPIVVYRGIGKGAWGEQHKGPTWVSDRISEAEQYGHELFQIKLHGDEKFADFSIGAPGFSARMAELGVTPEEIKAINDASQTRGGFKLMQQILEKYGYDGIKGPQGESGGMEYNLFHPERYSSQAVSNAQAADLLATEAALQSEKTGESQQPQESPVTSIKNKIVNELRAERGESPVPGSPAETREMWLNEAERAIKDNPNLPNQLITELKEKPRIINPIETATLQLHYGRVQNLFTESAGELFTAYEEGDIVATERALANANLLSNQINEIEEVSKAVGAEWGRAGVARQIALKKDFSLAAMVRRVRVAKGGEQLSPEELSTITKLSNEIGLLQDNLQTFADMQAAKEEAHPDARIRNLQFELHKKKGKFVDIVNQTVRNRQTPTQRAIGRFHETLRATRSIKTAIDFPVLRQGALVAVSHPIWTAKVLPSMFKAFASEKSAFVNAAELDERPGALFAKQAGLSLTSIDGDFSVQEEAFMSRWSKHIPIVAASERAYITFLNNLRAKTFDTLVSELGRGGHVTLTEAKNIANFVNVTTGRGGLGKAEQAATILATYFFAPRYVASRFQFLVGQPIWSAKGRAKKLIIREYARMLGGLGTYLGLLFGVLKFFKDEDDPDPVMELNPLSSEFGKIRIGNTRLDPLAGLSQTTVFVARMRYGQYKDKYGRIVDTRGEERPPRGYSTTEIMGKFLRSKLSPVLGAGVDWFAGEHFNGEQVTPLSMVRESIVPLALDDIVEEMQEEQSMPYKTAVSLAVLSGIGAQVYNSAAPGNFAEEIARPVKLIGRTEKGETYDKTDDVFTIIKQAQKLGYAPERMLTELDERLRIQGMKSAARQRYRKRFIIRWAQMSGQ